MVRIQGLFLLAGSAIALWFVLTHDNVRFVSGWFGYVVSGAAALGGVAMIITGENPFAG